MELLDTSQSITQVPGYKGTKYQPQTKTDMKKPKRTLETSLLHVFINLLKNVVSNNMGS